ncbi:MAG TPA: hypothetical protein VFA33_15015 [Bryobacteraceae bacterium]|nr:hypothetical protein [Bryobacteraceae bacterium]
MKLTLWKPLLLAAAFGVAVCAQQPAAAGAQEQARAPLWDVRVILKELSDHGGRLLAALNQIDPKSWTAKGAPDAYVTQWNSARAQARALSEDALTLSKDPEKLSFALKTYFRMQALEYMLRSLGEGVRKYQNPALADMLSALVGENGVNRERLQTYIVDLVEDREQQFQVMDREAQRCRAFLAQQTPPPQPRRKEGK